jgi:dihydroflavonol-4-reductase
MDLVTGATGHIGNVLVRQLISQGLKVRALVMPGEDLTPIKDLDIEQIQGDVLDAQNLEKAFQGVENVYHLAGIISIMPGDYETLKLVNVIGTRNIIHAARNSGVKRLTYTSSIHAIRRVPHGTIIDENIPFETQSTHGAYDLTKAQASLEVLNASQTGLDAVIVCPTGVIGPYDYRRSELGQVILGCVQKKPQVYIDGAYDFVDVRDVAQGLIAANEKGMCGETYILAGEQVSVRRMLETVWKYTGKRFPPIRLPLHMARFFTIFTPIYYRLLRVKPRLTPYSLETLLSNSTISHSKAQRELGFNPRPFTETIADTVKWFIDNMHLFKPSPSSME